MEAGDSGLQPPPAARQRPVEVRLGRRMKMEGAAGHASWPRQACYQMLSRQGCDLPALRRRDELAKVAVTGYWNRLLGVPTDYGYAWQPFSEAGSSGGEAPASGAVE